MSRKDKYGRGSAAANGKGFVDLVPGDTFAALEAQLKRRIADQFDNAVLGISAMIGSKRNASELAKHLASGEEEEVHKFAAKNIGVLFARGQLGISHDDKKAVVGQRWITRFIRVFAPFQFGGDCYLATLTLKDVDPDKRIYAVEAVEINQDAKSRSTPRGAISEDLNSAPFQDLTSQLTSMVSYYIGDVNRTHPAFVGRDEMFSTERTVELLEGLVRDFYASHQPLTTNHQSLTTNHQSPTFSIIIPVYNVAPYLRECLDSVLAQIFTNWEAVCVDDGSTDGGGAILDEYKEKVEKLGGGGQRTGKFVVIHQKNAGVGVARNYALTVARGDYLVFLDGDDLILPDYLQQIMRVVQSCANPDLIRLRAFIRLSNDGERETAPVRRSDELSAIGKCCEFLVFDAALCLNVYRRETVGDVEFPRGVRYGEDDVFLMRLLGRIRTVVQSDVSGYVYRHQRVGAASRTLRCADMAVLFSHLNGELPGLISSGADEVVLLRFYRAFMRKEIFRVTRRSSRDGSKVMRKNILSCISVLGPFAEEWPLLDRLWFGHYLGTGSWGLCDLIMFIRLCMKFPFRVVRRLTCKARRRAS